MGDFNVIDRFLADFIRYIDSGFGLVGGDVAFLTSTLIGIDITLAGLFWAMGGDEDVLARLIKKILYVGAFALIIGNFSTLADLIFRSFAGLGLKAGGGTIGADDLLRPGFLAGTGFDASKPLLDQAGKLVGFTSFFDNFLVIAILLLAWLFIILAFFILSIQLFITIIEFKLTTLAGFILVPFALWNRTAFLAERVLGNVVTAGIKIMVLAVIVGIGSGYFGEFVSSLNGAEPDIVAALSLVLASMALLGLGIYGPAIASGLIAGGPQLGAGAAVGTVAAGGGALIVSGTAAAGALRAAGSAGLSGMRAATSMGSAARTAYLLGQETSGSSSVAAGLSGVASAAGHGLADKVDAGLGLKQAAERGERAATLAGSSKAGEVGAASSQNAAPAWASHLRSDQRSQHRRQLALHALRDGERGGAGLTPQISEKENG